MASNKPLSRSVHRFSGSPLSSSATPGPRTPTLMTIKTMLQDGQSVRTTSTNRTRRAERAGTHLTRASAEACESFSMSRYSDSGNEMPSVRRMVTTGREMKNEATAEGSGPTRDRSTRGIVSPMMTQKAHMPPNANENWKKDAAARPARPKHESRMSMSARAGRASVMLAQVTCSEGDGRTAGEGEKRGRGGEGRRVREPTERGTHTFVGPTSWR